MLASCRWAPPHLQQLWSKASAWEKLAKEIETFIEVLETV